ncbi:hypothetical protein FS842_005361 [Serendipita sp. 407]|nr:hypothetical protein FS842_005361 [Serendipita sp. 407]
MAHYLLECILDTDFTAMRFISSPNLPCINLQTRYKAIQSRRLLVTPILSDKLSPLLAISLVLVPISRLNRSLDQSASDTKCGLQGLQLR